MSDLNPRVRWILTPAFSYLKIVPAPPILSFLTYVKKCPVSESWAVLCFFGGERRGGDIDIGAVCSSFWALFSYKQENVYFAAEWRMLGECIFLSALMGALYISMHHYRPRTWKYHKVSICQLSTIPTRSKRTKTKRRKHTNKSTHRTICKQISIGKWKALKCSSAVGVLADDPEKNNETRLQEKGGLVIRHPCGEACQPKQINALHWFFLAL